MWGRPDALSVIILMTLGVTHRGFLDPVTAWLGFSVRGENEEQEEEEENGADCVLNGRLEPTSSSMLALANPWR
jgi:hypothetical protein